MQAAPPRMWHSRPGCDSAQGGRAFAPGTIHSEVRSNTAGGGCATGFTLQRLLVIPVAPGTGRGAEGSVVAAGGQGLPIPGGAGGGLEEPVDRAVDGGVEAPAEVDVPELVHVGVAAFVIPAIDPAL